MEENPDIKSKLLKGIKAGLSTVFRIVLGILIAIQINAWNGESKRVHFLKKKY